MQNFCFLNLRGVFCLIDPQIQQLALQLRLIRQLLQPTSLLSPLFRPVATLLCKHNRQSSSHISLLFPDLRGTSNTFGSLGRLLYTALDVLPRLPHDEDPNQYGAMLHRSPVAKIFQLSSDGFFLQWRDLNTLTATYASLSQSMLAGQILSRSLLAALSPSYTSSLPSTFLSNFLDALAPLYD
ncbi:hypothetical protein BC941DRAFT_518342 [Chlamydoabsidia padenii]|nr:hypothetical protein BC941DRAFT_518342 [Chlamydoabsidia padenii]